MQTLTKFSIKYYPQLIIIGLILLVYSQNLWFDFAYIDDNLIVFDEYDKISDLSKIPSTFVNGYLLDNYYRPMVMISFIIDTAIAGQSSMMYHLTNVVLHIIVSLFLFQILIGLGIKKTISLLAAAVFALHPLNVSAVSWIVGRNDLLLAVFSVASLFFYMKFREIDRISYLYLSLIAYFLAMLSKEVGILIPAVFFLYELLIRSEDKLKLNMLYSLFYFILPALVYLALRHFVASINVREEIGISSFIQNIYILFEYLAKSVYFFYIDPLPVKNNILISIGIITSIGLTSFLIANRKDKSNKTFMFGLLFFLILIVPTLLVRVNSDDGEFNYIDCRMYLPLFGLMISYAVIFEKMLVPLKKSIKVIFVCVLFIYLSSLTYFHNQVYKNGLTYWGTALDKNPNRATYWMGLGFYYYDNKMFLEAAQCATNAINLKPDIGEYYFKAALAYEATGDLLTANEYLEKGLETGTNKSVIYSNLIKNYLRLGNKEKAVDLLNQLEQLDISDLKKNYDLYSSLAYFFSYSEFFEESIVLMKKAITYQPGKAKLLNDLGVFYFKVGEIDSAKKYITEAIELDPYNTDFQNNLNIVNK